MNRNILFAGAAVVGVAAALLLYQQTAPSAVPAGSDGSVVPGADQAAEGGAEAGAEDGSGPKAVRGGERKSMEDRELPEGKDPAVAARRDALLNGGFGKHSREVAPKFQLLAMQLKTAGAQELSDEMRVYSQELRQRRMEENVDKAAVLEKERALFQKVKDAGLATGEVGETLALLEQALATYEADAGAPAEAEATDPG